MRLISILLITAISVSASSWCDLDGDGTVDVVDVETAIHSDLGSLCVPGYLNPCDAPIVHRVIQAALGGSCHSVFLNWTASTSPNVTGYYIYRGAKSGGPYTRHNLYLATGTSYLDATVDPGQVYFYVVTAVASGIESAYSSETAAVVP